MITAYWMNEPGQQDQLDYIRDRGLRWGRATKDGHAYRVQIVDGKEIHHTKQKDGKRHV
jgi:hypothetical protein